MKILKLNDLKNPDHQAPFYAVIDETKRGTPDARACGCASLALLNMILVLKNRGLRVDLNFLLQAFYFSKPTTLIFFAVNPGGQNGQ